MGPRPLVRIPLDKTFENGSVVLWMTGLVSRAARVAALDSRPGDDPNNLGQSSWTNPIPAFPDSHCAGQTDRQTDIST